MQRNRLLSCGCGWWCRAELIGVSIRRLAARGLGHIDSVFVTQVFSLLRLQIGYFEVVAFVICALILAWYLNCRHGLFVVEGAVVFYSVDVRRIGAFDEVPFWFFVVFEVARRRHRHLHVLWRVNTLFFLFKLHVQEHFLLEDLLGKVFCWAIYLDPARLQSNDVVI